MGKIIVVLLVAAMAVKQITCIIKEGSIFGSLRKSIKARAEKGSNFWIKMDQLVTCKLCLSTQISIWLVGIPTAIVIHNFFPIRSVLIGISPGLELALLILGAFMLSMAVAATAMFLWNVAEFPWWLIETARELGAQRGQHSNNNGGMAKGQKETVA